MAKRKETRTVDFGTFKTASHLKLYCEARGMEQRGRDTYVCPICGSGSGPHKTAAFHLQGSRWKCFSCENGGDIYDLEGILAGTEDKMEQFNGVAALVGYEGFSYVVDTNLAPKPTQDTAKPTTDYTTGREREAGYLQDMRANIHDPEAVAYIQGRGFTLDEAVAWGLGYDPTRHRLILPWAGSDYYHIDRSTTDQGPKYTKPKTADVGPQPLYNPAALEAPVFFVVEGVLDAMAVTACGFQAVALGGTGGRAAVEAMTARRAKGAAIVMLDSDEAGARAAADLRDMLDHAGIMSTTATTKTKDAAEWLQADRDALTAFLQAEYDQAGQLVDNMREAAYNAALERLRVMNPAKVTEALYDLSNATPPTPTGFSSLDAILGGGLQPGLYVLGAVSSLGKTTFCVQVADQIAATGRAVLFVTIEQSAAEITAKSLSRIMSACGKSYSTTDVSSPTRREAWTTTDYSRFVEACNSYASEVAPTLRILEGNKQPSVDDVQAVAEVMADYYGQTPIIFLDYLQLLAPQSDRDSDKQATDKNVRALRQMARDLQAPVFVVSSLNRSSYSEGVTMDAFKESGAIEYGADVLLGLQPEGMREHMDSAPVTRAKREADKYIRESKGAEVRACEIVVLKNRAGRTPDEGIPFTFRPVASTFREGQGAQTRQTVRRI